MDANAPGGLLRWFGDWEDPRPGHHVMHPLTDVLAIAILAVLCGADSWVDVATFGHCQIDWLRTFLSLPHGVPSHDPFGRVSHGIDVGVYIIRRLRTGMLGQSLRHGGGPEKQSPDASAKEPPNDPKKKTNLPKQSQAAHADVAGPVGQPREPLPAE